MLKDNEYDWFGVFVFIGLLTCVIAFGLEATKYFPYYQEPVSATTAKRLGGFPCE